jgi:hypothetical protein
MPRLQRGFGHFMTLSCMTASVRSETACQGSGLRRPRGDGAIKPEPVAPSASPMTSLSRVKNHRPPEPALVRGRRYGWWPSHNRADFRAGRIRRRRRRTIDKSLALQRIEGFGSTDCGRCRSHLPHADRVSRPVDRLRRSRRRLRARSFAAVSPRSKTIS